MSLMKFLIRAADKGLRLLGAHRTLLALRSRQFHDPEIALLPYLVDPQKVAIDIGANQGLYSIRLVKLARRCVAIEPNPQLCAFLKKAIPRLEVHQFAASSKEGTAMLRIPVVNGSAYDGWATIENGNEFAEIPNCSVRQIYVQTCRGDNLNCSPVGFIKIDAEGHELDVLDGLSRTIQTNQPNLLIEIGLTGCGAPLAEICGKLPHYLPLRLIKSHLQPAPANATGNIIFLPLASK